jgi:hypothetical protein
MALGLVFGAGILLVLWLLAKPVRRSGDSHWKKRVLTPQGSWTQLGPLLCSWLVDLLVHRRKGRFPKGALVIGVWRDRQAPT